MAIELVAAAAAVELAFGGATIEDSRRLTDELAANSALRIVADDDVAPAEVDCFEKLSAAKVFSSKCKFSWAITRKLCSSSSHFRRQSAS